MFSSIRILFGSVDSVCPLHTPGSSQQLATDFRVTDNGKFEGFGKKTSRITTFAIFIASPLGRHVDEYYNFQTFRVFQYHCCAPLRNCVRNSSISQNSIPGNGVRYGTHRVPATYVVPLHRQILGFNSASAKNVPHTHNHTQYSSLLLSSLVSFIANYVKYNYHYTHSLGP